MKKKEGVRVVTKMKIRRVELGMKQKEVAALAGITPQYLRNIEAGRAKNPSIEVMKKLSEILDSSPNELFFESAAATANEKM